MTDTLNNLSDKLIGVGPAPVQIDGYYVKELHCSVRNDVEDSSRLAMRTGLHIQIPDVMRATPIIKIDMLAGTHAKKLSEFRIQLRMQSAEEDDSPYMFDMTLVGYFSVNIKPVKKGMTILFYRNAVMLLYSAAREILASVTGRGPFPAFVLPTLAFSYNESVLAELVRIEEESDSTKRKTKKKPAQLPPANAKAIAKKATKKTSTKK